ncbi:hypothetical protein V2A60_005251 [Cordyceps javanica]
MPENQGSPSQTPSQGSSRGKHHNGRRGGRNGRGSKLHNGPAEGSSDAPALNGDVGVSGSTPNGHRPAGRRAFGGHLTTATGDDNELTHAASPASLGLSADAPEFVPGQPVMSRSSTNPEPTRPELKCDDECLRQERNRRLAAALNIDPATHTNDHVPYSDDTLALFRETPTWCETQEREFRVFSQSPTEIRIRYKPMPNNQRRFLHVLAEDYGLESRSEDNEPFRYVLVYKGPRFVSAPSKTIAQCVKIRKTQEAAAAAAAAALASTAVKPPPLNETEPLNAFLLTSPRFGLTTDEVGVALAADLAEQPALQFRVEYLPSDEVLMRATVQYSSFLSAAGIETALRTLKKSVTERVRNQEIAGNVFLCHVDASDAITRREDSGRADGVGGWSAVASRAAAKKESAAASAADTSPAKGTGRRLLGLRKKRTGQAPERAWASQLDGDVEC